MNIHSSFTISNSPLSILSQRSQWQNVNIHQKLFQSSTNGGAQQIGQHATTLSWCYFNYRSQNFPNATSRVWQLGPENGSCYTGINNSACSLVKEGNLLLHWILLTLLPNRMEKSNGIMNLRYKYGKHPLLENFKFIDNRIASWYPLTFIKKGWHMFLLNNQSSDKQHI